MKRYLSLAIIVAVCSVQAQGTYEAITGFASTNPPVVGTSSGTVGWTFRTSTNLAVVSLGALNSVVSGSGTIFVGLWNSTGLLLASNAVTSTSALASDSRFAPITPVWLTSSEVYHLGAFAANGTIGFGSIDLLAGDTVFGQPELSMIGSAAANEGFAFPASVPEEEGLFYMAPNFQFTLVPEPSAFALTLCGLLLYRWKRR